MNYRNVVLATMDNTFLYTFCFPFLVKQGLIFASDQSRVGCRELTSPLPTLTLTLGSSQTRGRKGQGVGVTLLLI